MKSLLHYHFTIFPSPNRYFYNLLTGTVCNLQQLTPLLTN